MNSTIAALSTAPGGAISLVRLSGPRAMEIASAIFSKPLTAAEGYTVHYGEILNGEEVVDQVLATIFRAPRSYTGEDLVEFSCHGSSWISSEILRLLRDAGAEAATAGEFTMRAFFSGKLDLAQAEAVADLIAAESRSAARVALSQMRGGYSAELREMNAELLHILSMLELELDFGEEDVEFADRSTLTALVERIRTRVDRLAESFRLGNVLKNGIPVAIVGPPNVGKSTLLNRLLGEERAIVSAIAGTTRDFIEECLVIDGVQFRFIDTAGLRTSDAATDDVERIGIERSYEKLRSASIVLHLTDDTNNFEALDLTSEQKLIVIANKSDLATFELPAVILSSCAPSSISVTTPSPDTTASDETPLLHLSAKYGTGIEELKSALLSAANISSYDTTATVVSNARHYEALTLSHAAFDRTIKAITSSLPTDIIAAEIRAASFHLSEITGEITTSDILENIFSKFCIGK